MNINDKVNFRSDPQSSARRNGTIVAVGEGRLTIGAGGDQFEIAAQYAELGHIPGLPGDPTPNPSPRDFGDAAS